MQYLDSFTLPTASAEEDYFLNFPPELEMLCYSHESIYPFKIFPQKQFSHIKFEPITIFYGGNGSGKSTLLNLIAQKTGVDRGAPFNHTPFFDEYLRFCDFELTFGGKLPSGSRIITSDDVFDFLLDLRMLNDGVDRRREELFGEYIEAKKDTYLLRSLEDYEEFKRRNEAKRSTRSAFVRR